MLVCFGPLEEVLVLLERGRCMQPCLYLFNSQLPQQETCWQFSKLGMH